MWSCFESLRIPSAVGGGGGVDGTEGASPSVLLSIEAVLRPPNKDRKLRLAGGGVALTSGSGSAGFPPIHAQSSTTGSTRFLTDVSHATLFLPTNRFDMGDPRVTGRFLESFREVWRFLDTAVELKGTDCGRAMSGTNACFSRSLWLPSQ